MKKFFLFFMVLSMLVSFAGCQNTSPSEGPETPSSSIGEEPDTPEPEFEGDPFAFDDVNYSIKLPVYDMVKSMVSFDGDKPSVSEEYFDYTLGADGRIESKKTDYGVYFYEYDDNGRIIAENYSYNDGGYRNESYLYNEEGQISKKTITWDDDPEEFQVKYSYQYDGKGRIIEKAETYPDGKSAGVYTYEYAPSGLAVNETETHYEYGFNSPIKSHYTIVNSFDPEGNMIKREGRQTIGGNSRVVLTYQYDCVGYVEYSSENSEELNPTDVWEGFDECLFLPRPDTCVKKTAYESEQENSGVKIYTYILSDDKVTANTYYHMYQCLISDVCGLSAKVDENGAVYISKDGTLVSVMMAGTDDSLGYFLQISFPIS